MDTLSYILVTFVLLSTLLILLCKVKKRKSGLTKGICGILEFIWDMFSLK